MPLTRSFIPAILAFGLATVVGCDAQTPSSQSVTHDHDHDHGHGHGHDHEHDHDDHDHGEEMPLPPLVIGDLSIECNQAHGPLEAGVEGHLVVKLPYSDDGASVVRAWIGGEDRTMSMVGLGVYAASHDDYDIHTMAPDPLPNDVRWWIEIERPDGTTLLGSVAPIVD